ncbi:type II toxin-antitoxin system RelB/DinJ family antitoxin [Treponema sp. OMZ 840]|uniref:type II toxin-antitoxin system RelB/DinJ family antitoxin n=1 Tax=Treponema sp. OMZ 840 TaxID=244313 RepID=UPI003D8B7CAE
MAGTLVQIRVDEKLKEDAAAVYERLGLDLSTAVRIFFKRSVAENGIPFSMKLGKTGRNSIRRYISKELAAAMQSMAQSAAVNGISDMSLEDITAEIDAARKGQ